MKTCNIHYVIAYITIPICTHLHHLWSNPTSSLANGHPLQPICACSKICWYKLCTHIYGRNNAIFTPQSGTNDSECVHLKHADHDHEYNLAHLAVCIHKRRGVGFDKVYRKTR